MSEAGAVRSRLPLGPRAGGDGVDTMALMLKRAVAGEAADWPARTAAQPVQVQLATGHCTSGCGNVLDRPGCRSGQVFGHCTPLPWLGLLITAPASGES